MRMAASTRCPRAQSEKKSSVTDRDRGADCQQRYRSATEHRQGDRDNHQEMGESQTGAELLPRVVCFPHVLVLAQFAQRQRDADRTQEMPGNPGDYAPGRSQQSALLGADGVGLSLISLVPPSVPRADPAGRSDRRSAAAIRKDSIANLAMFGVIRGLWAADRFRRGLTIPIWRYASLGPVPSAHYEVDCRLAPCGAPSVWPARANELNASTTSQTSGAPCQWLKPHALHSNAGWIRSERLQLSKTAACHAVSISSAKRRLNLNPVVPFRGRGTGSGPRPCPAGGR